MLLQAVIRLLLPAAPGAPDRELPEDAQPVITTLATRAISVVLQCVSVSAWRVELKGSVLIEMLRFPGKYKGSALSRSADALEQSVFRKLPDCKVT